MAEILSPGAKLEYINPEPNLDQSKTADTEASAQHGGLDPDEDELQSGKGKTWSQWAVDQVKYTADEIVHNNLSDEVLKESSDGAEKTWGQWATRNALAAKGAAASNVNYVKDAAVAGLSNVTRHSFDGNANGEERKSVTQAVLHKGVAIKDTISSSLSYAAGQSPRGIEHKTMTAQDVVDRYSTMGERSAGGQQSRTQNMIDTGWGIKDGIAIQLGYGPDTNSRAGVRAAAIKEQARQRAATAFTPGEGESGLSKTITESLSNLPNFMKGNIWVSSSGHTEESAAANAVPLPNSSLSETSSTSTGGLVHRVADVVSSASGVVTPYLPASVSSYLPGRQTPPQEATKPHPPESTLDHEVTFEDKLEKIEDEKLMELWTIGNAPLDFTVNTASLETDSCFSPHKQIPPKSNFYSEGLDHNTHAQSKEDILTEAHRMRVNVEARAYLEAELCKAEAHAQNMLTKAEKHRLDEEAKALETLKKEELRAELVVHSAEIKMEKILSQARSRAVSMRAAAEENYAKDLAEAKTKADRFKAEVEETKRKEIAELQDRVERMITMEELPASLEHRGVVQKVKEKVFCHLRP